MTIVGVADRDFRGSIVGLASDVFIPVMMEPQLIGVNWLGNRNNRWVHAFMRLPPGMHQARADVEAARVSAELAAEYPIDSLSQRAVLVPIWQWPYGAQSYMLPAIRVIGAMSALLLVVVCANVAGLMLARSIGRRGEMATRLALGASRGRILRQLIIESQVLAIPGGMAGLLLPRIAEPFIGAAASNVSLPLFFNVEPDRFVLGFTVLLACVSTFVYGLVPALRLTRLDLTSVLKDHLSPLASTSFVRTALVVAQVALSLMLLVGTGLILRSLDAAQRADAGFDPRDVTWASLDARAGGHTERTGRVLYERLLKAITAESGLETATVAAYRPLTLIDWETWNFVPEGYRRRNDNLAFAVNIVGPDYFRTLGISVAAGREFDWRDDEAADSVVIVNETFARRFWGSAASGVGRRVEVNDKWATVVGVAHDIKYARLDEDPRPYVYVPFTQMYRPDMTLHVRGKVAPADVLERILAHAQTVDPNLPILSSGVLADQMRSAVSIHETVTRVLGIIGLLAAGMAAVGLYGLIAFTVKQSAHEIGVRIAMGATRHAIAGRFLRRGVTLAAIGTVLGIVVALALTRLMSGLLVDISADDPMSFAGATLLVMSVTLVASFVPAWRAAKTDPIAALRHR